MAWVKVDDRFTRGPKCKRAARHLGGGKRERARVLAVWLDAMSYCNTYLTDGFFPDHEMVNLPDSRPADVFAAMAHGDDALGPIVERDDQRMGWVFRNYCEYQPARAEVEARQEWDRRRKQLYSMPGLVESIRNRDGNCCRYCGRSVNWRDRRSSDGGTYDHVTPRGDNSFENVVVCCLRCSNAKGGRTLTEAGMSLLDAPDKNQFGTSYGLVPPIAIPARPGPARPVPKDQEHAREDEPAIRTAAENNAKAEREGVELKFDRPARRPRTGVDQSYEHRACPGGGSWAACARGYCVPSRLVARWTAQGVAEDAIAALVASHMAEVPIGALMPSNGFSYWGAVWDKHHGIGATAEHRPAPMRAGSMDWAEECRELHNSACSGQYLHGLRMQRERGVSA